MNWLQLFKSDVQAYSKYADRPPRSTLGLVARIALLQRLQAVLLFRLSQSAGARWGLATLIKWGSGVLTGSDISASARIGAGLQLHHPVSVVIGPRCVVGDRCQLMQGVTLGHGYGGSPVIGDDVFIGSNAVIVGPITVGDGAHIGANAVVTSDVPPRAVVRAPESRVVKVLERPRHVR
ncbi:MAG TPA: serine acetyltransferase [Mycobacteriales bacterium]|nr:serine acetyltransferase [Mycobacteriales bacterium]